MELSLKYPANLRAGLFWSYLLCIQCPFLLWANGNLEGSLTLNSISLVFSRFLLWEELGGPEKDLFVFWLVLKKTLVSLKKDFFFCFFFV